MIFNNKLLTAVMFSCITITSQAALFDRGNGMIYDSDLDITWLQDANYATTSGYDSDGRMTWSEAIIWADQLNYGEFNDWRLPSVGETPTRGQNVTSGELGYMFYTNLGNSTTLDNVSFVDAGESSESNTISFLNVQSRAYWYSEDYIDELPRAWAFSMLSGAQQTPLASNNKYAWAVRSGDVSEVPVPSALWLFSSALFIVISKKRLN